MQRAFYPAAGATINAELGFFARSVTVSSGANFVTVGAQQAIVVPPNVIGQIIPLDPAQSTAVITVTASPIAVAPVGPAQQVNATIVFSDQEQAATPGVVSQPQTVAPFATLFPLTSSGYQINCGLARGLTMLVWTQAASGLVNVIVQSIDNDSLGTIAVVSGGSLPTLTPGFAQPFAFGAQTSSMFDGPAGPPNSLIITPTLPMTNTMLLTFGLVSALPVGWTFLGSGHAVANTAGAAASITIPAGGVPVGALLVIGIAQVLNPGLVTLGDSRGNTYNFATALQHTAANANNATYLAWTQVRTALLAGDTINYTPNAAALDASLIAAFRIDTAARFLTDPIDPIAPGVGSNAANSTAVSSGPSGVFSLAFETSIAVVVSETTAAAGADTFTQAAGWGKSTALQWEDVAEGFWMNMWLMFRDWSAPQAVTASGTLASGNIGWAAILNNFTLATISVRGRLYY